MSLRKTVSIAALLGVAIGGWPSPSAASTDPAQLLRDAVHAYAKYSFVGQIQSVGFGSSRADAVLFRIEHRAPGLTRRWYLAPQSLYGDSIISRGDMAYNIDVHNRVIVASENDAIEDQVTLDDNFDLLLRNYRAVMGPDDSVAGRRAYQVFLVNRYTGETVMRVSIDAGTNLVLAREQFASSGAVTDQMRFEQIRFTAAIPAQIFDLPQTGFSRLSEPGHSLASPNLSALVKTAGFHAGRPKYLPAGFVMSGGDVSRINGVPSLHLMYSDGLRIVSLFENARGAAVDLNRYSVRRSKVGSYDAQYVEDGATCLLAWSDGRLHYALVSEMGLGELTRIAASIS